MQRLPLRVLSGLLLLTPIFVACGDDGPNGPEPLPPRTITYPAGATSLQDAVNRIAVDGTIVVSPGTHAVSTPVVIPAIKSGITITSRADEVARGDAARPILDADLDAADENVFTIQAEDVTIEGLEIEGTYLDGVFIAAPGATVTDCKIVGPLQNAITCSGTGVAPTIERNYFIAPGRFGVASGLGADPVIERNTIVDAGDCGIYSANTAPVVTANIIVGSAQWGVFCSGSATPVLSCNVLFDNLTDDYSSGCEPGVDDRHADPRFCDTDTYSLDVDSPCLDTVGTCGWVGASEEVCFRSAVRFPADAATLREAVDMLAPGGTLMIEAGTHSITSTTTIPISKAGITITGADGRRGGDRPVLDMGVDTRRDDAFVVGAADVTFSGIAITGTYRHGIVTSSTGVIEDCWIENADENAIQCSGAEATPTLRGNYLIGSGRFGVSCTQMAAPTVERNTIVDTGDCGIYTSSSAPDCRANVIVGSQNWGIACFGTVGPTLSCNVLYESVTADYSPGCEPGESDLPDTDPEFCETDTFTLLPSSPCISGAGGCGWIGASEVVCEP